MRNNWHEYDVLTEDGYEILPQDDTQGSKYDYDYDDYDDHDDEDHHENNDNNNKDKLTKLLQIVIGVAIIIVIVSLIRSVTSSNKPGVSGIVSYDGDKISIYETKDEAKQYAITSSSEVHTLKVSKSGNSDVSVTRNGFPDFGVVTDKKDKTYSLDFQGKSGSSMLVKIQIGGDGSWIGKRMSNDVDTYYLAINVEGEANSDSSSSSETTIFSNEDKPDPTAQHPNGKIYIGEDSYQTYGSEADAHNAVVNKKSSFTLPISMVQDGLKLSAKPNKDTARILISVCMVGEDVVDTKEVRLNQDSNWTGTLDVSKYSGNQITLMLKAENSMALSNGYSYVSIWIPKFKVQSEENSMPPVAGDFSSTSEQKDSSTN